MVVLFLFVLRCWLLRVDLFSLHFWSAFLYMVFGLWELLSGTVYISLVCFVGIICPWVFRMIGGSTVCRLLVNPYGCFVVDLLALPAHVSTSFCCLEFCFRVVLLCSFFLFSLWLFLSRGLVSSLPLSPILELPLALEGLLSSASVESPVRSSMGSSLWAESVAVWLLCTPSHLLVFRLPLDISQNLPPPASIPLLFQSAVPR